MIAIARFNVPISQSDEFCGQIQLAHQALAECVGYIDGEYGKNLEDATLWTLVTRWENVGSYRRALSSTRSKLEVVPVLARAIDEPGAYEIN